MKKSALVLVFLLMTGFYLRAQPQTQEVKMNRFINELMAKMTLEEKIGQLNLPVSGDITTGQTSSTDIANQIRKGRVGGLFNIKTAQKIAEVQKIAVEESRLGIPLIFGMDVIHGYKTTFPIPLGLSCTWNMEAVERSARIAALEASADGICWTFSPMVDLSRDPRWGRVSEGNGEDPYLSGEIAKAMVRGYQGTDLTKDNTLMACVKHYALYGAAEGGRDYNTTDMSRLSMYNEYFPPYKAAVDAGVGSVMASFNEVDGIPATANRWLMTDVLRNQWGFNGFIVTDYTGINEMIEHGMGDLQTVSALALKAGIDMDMVGEGFLTTLGKSLKEGKITEKEIDQACRRVLEAKFKLGLFEHPYQYCDVKRAEKEVFTPENRQQARAIAAESFVLLKNENQLLPLKKDQKIALIGPLGNNRLNMAGTWSVATDFDQAISVLEGMQAVADKPELINWVKGSNILKDAAYEARISIFGKDTYRDKRSDAEMINEAVALAMKSDVVVAAVGEAAEMSGESSSRADIGMPDVQQELLRAMIATGKPVVVVLFTGRPLTLTWEDAHIPAILNVWFPGTEAGTAIADALYGDAVPSGKLTTSFPRMVGQIPLYYNHKNTGRPLGDGAWFSKFRSNYLDVPNDPLYPFGYGLSYTKFEYSDLKISHSTLKPEERLKVEVTLKNTGNYDAMEVVQLYIRDQVGSITRPVKELKDFKKVALKKGEQTQVEFTIDIEDLKFYNSNLEFVAEPGAFTIFVGGNSRDVLQTDFKLIE